MKNQPHPSQAVYRVVDYRGQVVYLASHPLQADHFVRANPGRYLRVLSPGGRDITGSGTFDQKTNEVTEGIAAFFKAVSGLAVTGLILYVVYTLLFLQTQKSPLSASGEGAFGFGGSVI